MNNLYRSLLLLLAMVLFALAFPPLSTAAETKTPWWFEVQEASGKNPAKAILWYEKDFTNRLGLYALLAKESTNGYTEAYVGPKFKLSDRLTMGIGLGRETMTGLNAVRRNIYYDANWGKFSSFGTFENGGSGAWHKITATYALNERFGTGVMHETSLGLGPRLEYNFKKENVQLWGAVLHDKDTGRNNLVLGVNKSF